MSLVIPLSWPCTSTIAIQVPNRHTCRALLVGPHDKLLLGLLSKISTCQREWLGRGERKRGAVGIPTKPAAHPQTKERDKILLLLTSKKEFISITNHCCLEARKSPRGHQELKHVCICVCVYNSVKFVETLLFLDKKQIEKKGANICQVDKDKKKIPTCCFAFLRASRSNGGMRLFFCATLTPPLSMFCGAKTKHCTPPCVFCLSCYAHSFYVPYPLLFSILPLLPLSRARLLPPSLPSSHPLFPLANSQLSLPLSALFVIAD